MFSHFNKAQKFIVGTFVIVFILVNLASIILLYSEQINGLLRAKDIHIEYIHESLNQRIFFGDTIDTKGDAYQIANLETFELVSSNYPSKVIISNEKQVEILSGVLYITANQDISIVIFQDEYELKEKSEIIINLPKSEIIVLNGEMKFNSIDYNQNYAFSTNTKREYKFDRSELKRERNLNELVQVLNTFDKLPDTLRDLEPPNLEIHTPVSNEILTSRVVIVSGSSDAEEVFLNSDPVDISPSGSFEKIMTLEEGKNTIEFLAVDSYGNYKLEYVTVYVEIQNPISFSNP